MNYLGDYRIYSRPQFIYNPICLLKHPIRGGSMGLNPNLRHVQLLSGLCLGCTLALVLLIGVRSANSAPLASNLTIYTDQLTDGWNDSPSTSRKQALSTAAARLSQSPIRRAGPGFRCAHLRPSLQVTIQPSLFGSMVMVRRLRSIPRTTMMAQPERSTTLPLLPGSGQNMLCRWRS